MRYWRVERRQAEGQLDFGRTLELMAAIGHADVNAVAGAILKTVSTIAPIAQCTIFAYEFGNRPRTVAVADRRADVSCKISPTATRAIITRSTATSA
ncbi:Uncharacterised protein [Janthinobacterium lividum]|nr:Uncharacterised protein [Janthinobacterium lividum]